MKRSWRNMWGSRVFLKILPRVLSCRLHRQTSHLEIKLSEQGNQHERISSSQQKFQEWDPALTQIRAWDFTATISRQVTTSDDQKWTSKIRNISEIFSFSGKYFSAAPFFFAVPGARGEAEHTQVPGVILGSAQRPLSGPQQISEGFRSDISTQ